ncbi:ankyrin repeat and IBR domain-containing protein 1-like [Mizuhopecten yessoensis]|uniref:RBR-type E3 ubiquitin transferase n=1 Tax=Mizuhopecten yessoensis TaxID=6573 RepID=A0A210QRE1_MIZYE|nr:ankyrin repeat and IBR domain-containing protein 1-like [Mizuhopecten yessoensis]XP_021351914.1 ankyrin repeat and IBR domain-containing protein 1-like [Mizuhopecten yessoensis]XP_021351915.1 ankyrin repeat and IBR domain-containing protein 1-like [Mizuhopecten yessoensis]OWF51295.1 Ankyrin repeat and IBR domain-containing protein 1 [Mizuhopecten yessoensis]
MGSTSSKFRKHLNNGDEVAALNLYNSHSDLRKALDPNCSYGDSHQNETPLHYSARHGMKSLLRIFLRELGGNPNKTNGHKETCLHCVAMEKPCHSNCYPVLRRRADCLQMLLNWRGATLKDGEVEKIDLSAQDENLNTALHYAAASGLKRCVEMLVAHGAPLFTENIDQLTPCDSAERNSHTDIAVYLESKMVFSDNDGNDLPIAEMLPVVDSEEYSGLRAQDLQEAKDQLLVETADMLSVPLFTADALLRNHEWSREMLLEAWMSDPLACCEKSGVTPPPSLFSEQPQVQESLTSPVSSEPPSPDTMCDICTQSFLLEEEPVHMACKHQFCRCCWKEYLNLKIQEGDAHHITCPGFQCGKLVPVEIIENIVSREMARRYLQFDIKAFVESNPSIKWCPFPGCGRAVRLPELDGNNQTPRQLPADTSRAVDCGNKHYFCWDCGGEAHEPCSCDNWIKWYQKIAEVKPEQMDGTEKDTESAANCLWLVTNSKPCPNCKSPIQKNEGCNHMKCSKCKFDFCWVCLDQWKRHNSSTGGYFKCNRYEVSKIVEDHANMAQSDAEEKNKRMQEINKFVHYYTRFKNHENSYKFEEPLTSSTKTKMMKLAEAVTDPATANAETKFVEEAVEQLLKARRVLKCSYSYGYYLDGPGYKKMVFEFMQTELEECGEILSQMVNRLYLRTPRKRIIEQAHVVQRKRHEFIVAISKGLVPPETPPALRKHRRRRYSMDYEDEELRKAILASIQDVDPANPWIKDASGRHTNVMAVLDWPDSDDSDSDTQTTQRQPDKCAREGCNKLEAKNPRTGEWHQYCSRQCMSAAAVENTDHSEPVQEAILDEQMDLLRALEMSRLQYLRDQGIIADLSSTTASLLDSPGAAEGGSPIPGDESGLPSPQKQSKTLPDITLLPKSPRANGKQPTDKKGKSPKRSKDEGSQPGKLNSMTAMEELDFELQRVLEMSTISPSDLSPDAKLMLPKSATLPAPVSPQQPRHTTPQELLSPYSQHRRRKSQGRFDETTSTVVSRVPNKSVEDLLHDDCSIGCRAPPPSLSTLSSESDSPGECIGTIPALYTTPGLSSQSPITPSPPTSTYQQQQPNQSPGCFGIIKDLSVSNINTGEADKTRDFQGKNLSLFRDQKQERPSLRGILAANTPGEDEDNVFVLVSPDSLQTSQQQSWAYPANFSTSANNKHQSQPTGGVRGQESTPSWEMTSSTSSLKGETKVLTSLYDHTKGSAGSDDPGEMSLSQMAENLVHISAEMKRMVEDHITDTTDSNPDSSLEEVGATPERPLELDFDNLDELLPTSSLQQYVGTHLDSPDSLTDPFENCDTYQPQSFVHNTVDEDKEESIQHFMDNVDDDTAGTSQPRLFSSRARDTDKGFLPTEITYNSQIQSANGSKDGAPDRSCAPLQVTDLETPEINVDHQRPRVGPRETLIDFRLGQSDFDAGPSEQRPSQTQSHRSRPRRIETVFGVDDVVTAAEGPTPVVELDLTVESGPANLGRTRGSGDDSSHADSFFV